MVGGEEEVCRACEVAMVQHEVEAVPLCITGEDHALGLILDDEGARTFIARLAQATVQLEMKRAVLYGERPDL